MSLLSRLLNVFRPSRLDRDLDDELEFHLEQMMRERGMSRAEAIRRLGSPLRLREESRDVKLLTSLESLGQDLRYTVRVFRHNPMSVGAAIVSLSLAIGACAAVYSLVDALVLRPLPVANPEQLAYLTYVRPDAPNERRSSFSWPVFLEMSAAARGKAELFASSSQEITRPVTIDETPGERLRIQFISGDAFRILGIASAAGRLLQAGDDLTPGDQRVAVISHALWTRRFGSDPRVIGRTIEIDGRKVELVGVTAAGFTGLEPGYSTDLWLPTMMWSAPEAFTRRGWSWLTLWARRKAGVSEAELAALLEVPFRRDLEARARESSFAQSRERVQQFIHAPFQVESAATGPSGLRRTFARPLGILAMLVGLVLLIACANVANLLLARAAAREREFAVRTSIGASRGRLVRQLIVESAVLAALAGIVGTGVALIGAPLIVRELAPPGSPVWLEVGFSWRLLGFLLAISAGATMLFGLAPSLRGSRASLTLPAQASGRLTSPAPSRWLLGSEVAFSSLVLFLSGLFLTSLRKLAQVDLGFAKDGLTLVDLAVTEPATDTAAALARWTALEAAARHWPGVNAAGSSGWALLSGNGWNGDIRVGEETTQDEPVYFLEVSRGFFETMGMPLLTGRNFGPGETGAAVVNRAFVDRYFGGRNPTGRTFGRLEGRETATGASFRVVPTLVIGVTKDARYDRLRGPAPPMAYLPRTFAIAYGTLELRTPLDPLSIAGLLRRELPRSAPQFRVEGITTQDALVRGQMVRERMLSTLASIFAVLATVLAGVGLYGTLSYSVIRRTKEIGLRVALGAGSTRVAGRIAADALGVVALGTIVGLSAGMATERLVASLLFGVSAKDPASIAFPIVILGLSAVIATLPPALRAARVDPMVALRQD